MGQTGKESPEGKGRGWGQRKGIIESNLTPATHMDSGSSSAVPTSDPALHKCTEKVAKDGPSFRVPVPKWEIWMKFWASAGGHVQF